MLETVAQWPGAYRPLLGTLIQERPDRARSGLDWLLTAGMVDEKGGRYGLMNRGAHTLRLRDGVSYNHALGRSRALNWDKFDSHRQHEDGVLDVMSGFGREKLSVAAGWRCEEVFGDHKIVPDGMVKLGFGPFGPGWYYVEYERRARVQRRIEGKMEAYLSRDRVEGPPVLFVCVNERVENIVHEVCRGTRVLTTHPKRLLKGGPVGSGVWSLFGEPVVLG